MKDSEKSQKLIDSSVWISYLINGNHTNIIEHDEILFISSISLFEIKKKIMNYKIDKEKITKMLEFIKKRSLVIPINDKIAEKAAEISVWKKLPAIDSLIYASAMLNNLKLITLDNDFRGLNDVSILS